MDGIADRLSPGDKIARAQALWDEADDDRTCTPAERCQRDICGNHVWPKSLRYLPDVRVSDERAERVRAVERRIAGRLAGCIRAPR